MKITVFLNLVFCSVDEWWIMDVSCGAVSHLFHRTPRCTQTGSGKPALRSPSPCTLRAHSSAPCRRQTPPSCHRTDPSIRLHRSSCTRSPWAHTHRAHTCTGGQGGGHCLRPTPLGVGLGDVAKQWSFEIDHFPDKCQIFLYFKFKARFLIQSESCWNQTVTFPQNVLDEMCLLEMHIW